MSDETADSGTASRIALVTGGGTGVGKAISKALAGAGWTVVICGRRREVLETAAGEIGHGAVAMVADIGDPASVAALFEGIAGRFGRSTFSSTMRARSRHPSRWRTCRSTSGARSSRPT